MKESKAGADSSSNGLLVRGFLRVVVVVVLEVEAGRA